MNSGEKVNYFEVLGLSIEDLENQDEVTISKCVNDAFQKSYRLVGVAPNNPRFKGKDRGEWHVLFLEAKDTLIDPAKRRVHIEDLRKPTPAPAPIPASAPAPPRPIVKFPNGDEATSIPELAILMEKNSIEAGAALYRGSIALSLDGAGELHLAQAAREVVSRYPKDRKLGLTALVQILEKKIQFKGNKAGTPQQLARLIDQNWEDGKNLLYSGFIAFWLKYVNEEKLADTADRIINHYEEEKDEGLEFFVQRLDPHIGLPVPKTNYTSINFGKVDTETKKTIRLEIENAGRGFLLGDVELASEMPGFRVSSIPIRGRAAVTVELDARGPLTVKQRHETKLIIKTNGGELTVPISCYVDYPTEKSIRRVVISSLSMGAIALVVRWILLQLGGFRFSWLTSAKFVHLDNFNNKWVEWPLLEVQLYTPDFAGIGFVIAFAALGTGIFFFLWKRRPE